jgi:hypothetical protein
MASLAGASVGCDDDEPLYTKDASTDTAVVPDAAKDAVIAVDTSTPTPDTAKVDATPDTSADAKADGGIPDATSDTAKADATVDATPPVDTGGTPDAAPVDTASDTVVVDTAPPVVDTAPDTILPTDLAPMLINGCTVFQDGTAGALPGANRYIEWEDPTTFAAKGERCLEIKVGQSVVFHGDFNMHPLAASGGDAPAIASKASSTGSEEYEVTFPAVGTFGYKCTIHAPMTGAIHVIP